VSQGVVFNIISRGAGHMGLAPEHSAMFIRLCGNIECSRKDGGCCVVAKVRVATTTKVRSLIGICWLYEQGKFEVCDLRNALPTYDHQSVNFNFEVKGCEGRRYGVTILALDLKGRVLQYLARSACPCPKA